MWFTGDLKGNLWKFDLSSSAKADWKVALGGKPLFEAKTFQGVAQPITAAPLAVPHPDGGVVVVAGTGKFFDAADINSVATQTIYGVRDPVGFGTDEGSTITGTSTLVMQTIIDKKNESRVVEAFDNTTSTQTITFYEVSVNPIDWRTKNGWYFHQPYAGQRMVYPVSRVAGRLAKVDTIVPGKADADPCESSTPGKGYNYVIDAITGGSPQGNFLDTNADGTVDSGDTAASGYSTGLDGRDQVLKVGPGGPDNSTDSSSSSSSTNTSTGCSGTFVFLDATAGSILGQCEPPPKPRCTGPTCKEPPKVNRSWQQIFLQR